MNNKKLLLILALLLLTPPVHGQEAVPPSSIGQNQSMNANANPKAQSQPQLQPEPQHQFLPQTQAQPARGQEALTPNSVPVKFEGIVVQADPLAVKSVTGDVQAFIPSRQEASAELRADWPNSGDLVLLTYVPRARGHALTGRPARSNLVLYISKPANEHHLGKFTGAPSSTVRSRSVAAVRQVVCAVAVLLGTTAGTAGPGCRRSGARCLDEPRPENARIPLRR